MNGSRIIDDTYNANLKSIEAAMRVLSGFPDKRFFVLGNVGELGQWEEEHHRLIGQMASQLGLDGLFTCGLSSRYASEEFSNLGNELSFHCRDASALVDRLEDYLDSQTTVAVKGSRSSHMEDVVSKITLDRK